MPNWAGVICQCLKGAEVGLQEEMYSYVTVCDDQTTKGKGTVLVEET